jgi:uncharacterized membrane protein
METALRPMNLSELLDRTFSLYRKHFLLFIGIAVLPNLALLLFRLGILRLGSSPGTPIEAPLGAAAGKMILLNLLIVPAYLITISIVQAATIVAISDVHLGRTSGIGVAYAGIRDSLLDIILAMIIIGIGVTLGIILCIVPGILMGLAWSTAIPTIVIEKQGPLDAMQRSSQLTKGNRGSIFLIMLLVTLISYVIATIIEAPIILATGFSKLFNPKGITPETQVFLQIANFLASTLVAPVSTIATSLVYYNQRVRKEGFDLQLMMSSLKSLPQNPPDTPAVS